MIKVFPRHSVALSKEAFSILLKGIIPGKGMDKEDFIGKFGMAFAEYLGVKYAFGVSSGRGALGIILDALDFKQGTEVIVSDYNFPPVPLMLKQRGLKPIFVDLDPESHNLDISLVRDKITPRTGAILATHLFGQPCRMDAISDIAKENKIRVIEDCAHACGAEYQHKKTGTFGDVAYFSFGPGKSLPCFGGGSIVTNDGTIADEIRKICLKLPLPPAKKTRKAIIENSLYYIVTNKNIFPFTLFPFIYLLSFFNADLIDHLQDEGVDAVAASISRKFSMTKLQAAVGLSQLRSLDENNQKRIDNAHFLNEEFKTAEGIGLVKNVPGAKSIYLYYRILVDKRDQVRRGLLMRGIDSEKDDMRSCSSLEVFKVDKQDCPVAQKVHSMSLEIPCSSFLSQKDMLYISRQVNEAVKESRKD